MSRYRSRAPIAILLIISLIATAVLRNLSDVVRRKTQGERFMLATGDASQAGLTGMDSFALALLLGGLRGPLVMMLWTSSENQKSARDLEGFDTKVEWIRLLQPEFDSVHIFQIWNKAYNISAQMPTFRAKYSTILDAIQYAQANDDQHPNNINTLSAIAQIYMDKLGGTNNSDHEFAEQVRKDSLYRPQNARLSTVSHNRLPDLLNEDFTIKPKFLTPRFAKPASFPADQPWNNGAPLQYLEKYQPFPHGVSTYALAFDYYKRAQILQRYYGQHHIQLSETVVGSRPAVALRMWTDEERNRARALETHLLNKTLFTDEQQAAEHPFGPQILEDKQQQILLTAPVPLDTALAADAKLDEAIYSYELGTRLADDAILEYQEHMKEEGLELNFSSYSSAVEELQANALLMQADGALLRLLSTTDAGQRKQLIAHARERYEQAMISQMRCCLHYFVDGSVLADAGTTRDEVLNLSPNQIVRVYNKMNIILTQQPDRDSNSAERVDFTCNVFRAQIRLSTLTASGAR